MRISRVVVKNFRSFSKIDFPITENLTCILGENNTGKSNLFMAIRLCIDSNLSSIQRMLTRDDVHRAVDISHPAQVLAGLEITDFQGNQNEEALVHTWQSAPNRARIFFRFRPKAKVREALGTTVFAGSLTLDDYAWEIMAGGNPATDLADIEWDTEVGGSIRYSDLQAFLVVTLPALRDVEADLRQPRLSPLVRLIEASDIPPTERQQLVDILYDANDKIAASPTVGSLAEAADTAFKSVSGPAFSMDVTLGLADASFQSITRSLRILLSNAGMTRFEPTRNGLGLNNILYVSILVEYFKKRYAKAKSAGQLILIEEPEAHLHPQLQLSLITALKTLSFQTIMTTHSPHVTSQAELSSIVALTNKGGPATSAAALAQNPILAPGDMRDLERYLDATKSNLLYARKVMLVEGPAELFLIPMLAKAHLGIDLEREGISIVSIYGVHFDCYAKLFNEDCLPKKCAIVADADLVPGDEVDEAEDVPEKPKITSLEGRYVKPFLGATTFEREITLYSNFTMLMGAARAIGAPKVAAKIEAVGAEFLLRTYSGKEELELLEPIRKSVLATAKRFGKARFAQLCAAHTGEFSRLPNYIFKAIEWLREP